MKKIIYIFLLSFFLLLIDIEAFANDNFINKGLDIVVETDKEEYKDDENVKVKYILVNNNSLSLENVELSIVGPDGYSILNKDDVVLEWDKIEAGKEVSVSVELSKKEDNFFKIGNDKISPFLVIVFVLGVIWMLALITFIIIKVKNKNKFIGGMCLFLLCLSASISIIKVYASENADYKYNQLKSICINDSILGINTELSYSLEKEVEVEYTRKEWVTKLLELGNYPEDYDYFLQNPDEPADREFFAVSSVIWLGYAPKVKNDIEFCDDYDEISNKLRTYMAWELGLIELNGNKFEPSERFTNHDINNVLVQYEYIKSLREITENTENVTFQKNTDTEAEIIDVFETVDYIEAEGISSLEFTNFIPEEGIITEVLDGNALSVKTEVGDGWSVDANITINEVSVDYIIDMDINSKNDEYAMPVDIKNLYIKFDNDIVADVELINAQGEPKETAKTIKIGKVPVSGLEWLDIYVDVELVIDATGTGELQLRINGSNMVHIVDNYILFDKKFDFDPKANVMDDSVVEINLKFGMEILDNILIDMKSVNELNGYGYTYDRYTGMICRDTSWILNREFYLLEDSVLKPYIDIDIKALHLNLHDFDYSGQMHFEDGQCVNACTYVDNSKIVQSYADAISYKFFDSWFVEITKLELAYLNNDQIFDVIVTFANMRGEEEKIRFVYSESGVSEIHQATNASGRCTYTFLKHSETGKLRVIAYWWHSNAEFYRLFDEQADGSIVESQVCGVEVEDILNFYTSDTYNYIEGQGEVDDATYKAYVDTLDDGYTSFEAEIVHSTECDIDSFNSSWEFINDYLKKLI